MEVDAWFTNTAPVDAYRGAGRPEATYLLERLVSRCAWETWAWARTRSASRNFISSFPYQTPVALQYDVGDYRACMDQGRRRWPRWRAWRPARPPAKCQARPVARHRLLQLHRGLRASRQSNIAGALGARAGLFECGEIRVHPTGSVTVFTGSHSHGQGHETTFAQVVAARLGITGRERWTWCTATPGACLSAWAPTVRVRFRWAARPS